MIFTIDVRNGFVLKIITLKYFPVVLVIFLLFFISECYSQTLWGVDVQDFDSPLKWEEEEGIYFKSNIDEGDFDGIQFIQTVGFVFYISSAEIKHLPHTYNYLTNVFGKESLNKDYILPTLKSKINDENFEQSVNDGYSYIFREWKVDKIIVRLFWNQYRFWVEVINRNYK